MKKQSKPSPLKPRLHNYKLKPEQIHKNAKAYDRKKIKRKTKDILKEPALEENPLSDRPRTQFSKNRVL